MTNLDRIIIVRTGTYLQCTYQLVYYRTLTKTLYGVIIMHVSNGVTCLMCNLSKLANLFETNQSQMN